MKRYALSAIFALSAFAAACDDDDPPGNTTDSGTVTPDSGVAVDVGVPADSGTNEDSGVVTDLGVVADGGGQDATTMDADAGMIGPLPSEMEHAQFVQVTEGRIWVGDGTNTGNPNVDTFGSVKSKLGTNYTRSTATNTRSYEWRLADNVELTIWFADTNLDVADDQPPNDVDDTDEVLWIAVSGGYTGQTSKEIGIGSTRAEVEMAEPQGYGAPSKTTMIETPPGTLASYYTTGILVAYDTNDVVRTITICRSYNATPSGEINIASGALDYEGQGVIAGYQNLNPGTTEGAIIGILGFPDGEGMAPSGNIRILSWSFIGIEVYFFGSQTSALFWSVHAPYYGRFDNSDFSIGAARADVEGALALGAGESTTGNANIVCYPDLMDPEVMITYSMDATPLATSVTQINPLNAALLCN